MGPDSYLWGGPEDSPARRIFEAPPNGNGALGRFARAAIVHQPLTYLLAAFDDTARYLAPGFHARYNAADYDYFEIRRRDDTVEPDIGDAITSYYGNEPLSVDEDAVAVLTDFQQVLRVHPLLLLEGLILGGFGIAFSTGRVRAGLVLFVGGALLLIAVPSATATWTARYAVPADGAFVAAGAIGLWVLAPRLLERLRAPADLA